MFLTKLRIAGLLLLAAGFVGAGGLLTHRAVAGKDTQAKSVASFFETEADTPKSKDDDQTKLQGTWKVIHVERDGKEAPTEEGKLVFRGNKVTFQVGENKFETTYKLDSTTKPKRIELSYMGGPAEGKTKDGIYDLQGNILKICGNNTPGGAVPSEFATKPESGEELLVLKREEDKEKEADQPKADTDKKSSRAADRQMSANNLKQIGLAFHNYHDTNRHFPAHAIYSQQGKPLLSWRVAILPWIEQDRLYKQFKLDEPWDSEHNKKLLAQMPRIYAPLAGKTKDKHSTFYQVFVSKGTIGKGNDAGGGGDAPGQLRAVAVGGGKATIFQGKEGISIANIPDGLSNTILVVEAGEAVPWTKPEDLPFDPDKALPPLGGMFKGGFHILMADASVHFVKDKFDEKVMKLLIIRDDGVNVKVDDLNK